MVSPQPIYQTPTYQTPTYQQQPYQYQPEQTYQHQPYQYQQDPSEVCDDEYASNDIMINTIKNNEYKNLRALHKYRAINNQYGSMGMKCYTGPCADEIISTSSFDSYEFKLGSQPFMPKSQSKQISTNYYKQNMNNNNDDEFEE